MAHWHTDPKPCVDTPIRPYAAADSAAASSRTRVRMVSAGSPLAAAASSGVNPATSSATRSRLSTYAGGVASPSSNRTFSIASRTTASEPGRTK